MGSAPLGPSSRVFLSFRRRRHHLIFLESRGEQLALEEEHRQQIKLGKKIFLQLSKIKLGNQGLSPNRKIGEKKLENNLVIAEA